MSVCVCVRTQYSSQFLTIQSGLSHTWTEILKTGFLAAKVIVLYFSLHFTGLSDVCIDATTLNTVPVFDFGIYYEPAPDSGEIK